MVDRAPIIDRLLMSRSARTVTIVAPAGYGKTTLMTLWKEHDTRPTAWLAVDRHDNDPAALLTNIVAALRHAELMTGTHPDDIRVPSELVTTHGVARVVHALESNGASGALMLDHLENLRSRASNDVISELAARLPPAIQLVIASRTSVRLPVAVLRAQGALLELTSTDLAMDEVDARALLEQAGVDVGDDLGEAVTRTEGWPAGLYLVGLAIKSGSSRQSALHIGGNDRFLADYLREEVLGHLSDARVSFLIRTSILERFCGPLCDAVLGSTGSARIIERLEGSNLLIVPLDRTRDWYRYHHLLRDFLRAELVKREPDLVAGLHASAADWFDANGMPETAIMHAQAADDGDKVASIVGRVARATYGVGRAETAFEWLSWFEQTGRIARYPQITALGAWARVLSGDEAGMERWANALITNADISGNGHLPPSGRLLEAILTRAGTSRMRADARAARLASAADSEWLATAFTLEGLSDLWDENFERADSLFVRAVSAGESFFGLPAATMALASRAVIAIGRGDWDQADQLVTRARALIRERRIDHYITSGLTFAVSSRCSAHRGDLDGARRLLAKAVTIRPLLSAAAPGISVQTLLEMARAHLGLSDVSGARTVVREAGDILARHPDLGLLPTQLDEIKARLDTLTAGAVGATALTTAELRLLPFLVTHLSFPEIGERLYVSRHTVKTQAMSIYRKLGASSRSEAVQRATESGLLPA